MNQTPIAADPAEPSTLGSLQRWLNARMGSHVGVACMDTSGDTGQLFPEEYPAIAQAVPKRQREYAAGRLAARHALSQIGHAPCAIPTAADRSPVWPPGVVGSISHTNELCIAVTGWQHRIHAIGIDIEPDVPMDFALWREICTPEELKQLEQVAPEQRGRRVTRLFCAKEAFYKWQYPMTRQLLDFQEVRVELPEGTLQFHARVSHPNRSPAAPEEKIGLLESMHGITIAWAIGT